MKGLDCFSTLANPLYSAAEPMPNTTIRKKVVFCPPHSAVVHTRALSHTYANNKERKEKQALNKLHLIVFSEPRVVHESGGP